MKLTDFNPRWIGLSQSFDKTIRMGLSFDCPHCGTQRLVVHFRQPIDPQNLLAGTSWKPGISGRNEWDRSGDTFDNLTLAPSVDASNTGHWHGNIENGEVKTA